VIEPEERHRIGRGLALVCIQPCRHFALLLPTLLK
jgi:hypothetical protein